MKFKKIFLMTVLAIPVVAFSSVYAESVKSEVVLTDTHTIVSVNEAKSIVMHFSNVISNAPGVSDAYCKSFVTPDVTIKPSETSPGQLIASNGDKITRLNLTTTFEHGIMSFSGINKIVGTRDHKPFETLAYYSSTSSDGGRVANGAFSSGSCRGNFTRTLNY